MMMMEMVVMEMMMTIVMFFKAHSHRFTVHCRSSPKACCGPVEARLPAKGAQLELVMRMSPSDATAHSHFAPKSLKTLADFSRDKYSLQIMVHGHP